MVHDNEAVSNLVWLLDSGYSSHMTGRKEFFRQLEEFQGSKVKLGDGKEMEVQGKGSIAVKF